ncbi:MAG: hypothetical protein ABIK96_08920 [bacterium]
MSKIFDAYKKRLGDAPDLPQELGRTGTISLFPIPADPQREEFNRLASRLLGMRLESRGSVISFASSSRGEGSSYVSYQAAFFLANAYKMKVAWIDGNFLSPQKQLRNSDSLTLCDLLQDPERFEDMVTPDALTLLPGGENLVGARGLFADPRYTEILVAFTRRFDFTIIDLPPILNSTDTALMASETDGLLLVIEQKFLKWEIIEHGLDGLRNKGVRVLGSVINRRSFELPKFIYDRV